MQMSPWVSVASCPKQTAPVGVTFPPAVDVSVRPLGCFFLQPSRGFGGALRCRHRERLIRATSAGETEEQPVPLNTDSAAVRAFRETISDVAFFFFFFFLQW